MLFLFGKHGCKQGKRNILYKLQFFSKLLSRKDQYDQWALSLESGTVRSFFCQKKSETCERINRVWGGHCERSELSPKKRHFHHVFVNKKFTWRILVVIFFILLVDANSVINFDQVFIFQWNMIENQWKRKII